MKYSDFEQVISPERMRRYLIACHNDSRKAMTLYRYNLKLSQEMFTIISYFEVALRNKIDVEMKSHYGNNWLRDSVMAGGIFYDNNRVAKTKSIIETVYIELKNAGTYNHSKLLTELGFGIWKYMFNKIEYTLANKCLMNILPNKPKSSQTLKYNNVFVFNELNRINISRNRIAHHEPICISHPYHIDIHNITNCYNSVIMLFEWMNIDHKKLLYGLDHVSNICEKIKNM